MTGPEGGLLGTRRPVPALLRYYLLQSLATGPGLLFLIPLGIFRYRTLRYEFDAEGMTARWGILFRREISLTYARIQDIHLVSNVVERWLGLGRIQIQTASGQSGAEMTIEGLPDFERLRDELYLRMRGARGEHRPAVGATGIPTGIATDIATDILPGVGDLAQTGPARPRQPGHALAADDIEQVTLALREAVSELRAIRGLVQNKP
jgi:putative membrane protein